MIVKSIQPTAQIAPAQHRRYRQGWYSRQFWGGSTTVGITSSPSFAWARRRGRVRAPPAVWLHRHYLEEVYMAFEGEKDTDSPAADNAPAAALTDDQLERQLEPPTG
jgi:hypothetical protein